MNQKIVVGIGNIYATESLFMAGVSREELRAVLVKEISFIGY